LELGLQNKDYSKCRTLWRSVRCILFGVDENRTRIFFDLQWHRVSPYSFATISVPTGSVTRPIFEVGWSKMKYGECILIGLRDLSASFLPLTPTGIVG
jgi:hypothetical protein